MTHRLDGIHLIADRLTPVPRARQIAAEFRPFLALLQSLGVRSYLEVGAYQGGAFYRAMRHLPVGSLGVTVDNHNRIGRSVHRPTLEIVGERLTRRGYRIEHVFGNSQEIGTIAAVRRLGPFDAVFIDADHSYAGVKRDWEAYGPMGRHLVAFHDVAEEHTTRSGKRVEVPRLWQEIKASGVATREFIAPRSKRGIGVVLRP